MNDHVIWAVCRWEAEVKNRPLQNIHRRTLDDTWRQVIRHFGGDDRALCGPTHDERRALEGNDAPSTLSGSSCSGSTPEAEAKTSSGSDGSKLTYAMAYFIAVQRERMSKPKNERHPCAWDGASCRTCGAGTGWISGAWRCPEAWDTSSTLKAAPLLASTSQGAAVIRHFGGDDRALCGPTHDERRALEGK